MGSFGKASKCEQIIEDNTKTQIFGLLNGEEMFFVMKDCFGTNSNVMGKLKGSTVTYFRHYVAMLLITQRTGILTLTW